MTKRFGSAVAFKTSLETHLRTRSARTGQPFGTTQLRFVIERLLARLFHNPESPWLLKGGYAMDLRFRPQARTTNDVDLTLPTAEARTMKFACDEFRDQLQVAADHDTGDFLAFRIGEAKKEITNAPGGGARYRCEAIMLGKTYQKFQIDLGSGDANVGEPERLTGEDFLDFAGIGPAQVLAIPKAQQFAEKVHAYTFPWSARLNTRTKDLVDLVMLIERGQTEPAQIRSALFATFAARDTHPLPKSLNPPPESWAVDFQTMALEANLPTKDSLDAYAMLNNYWTENCLGGAA